MESSSQIQQPNRRKRPLSNTSSISSIINQYGRSSNDPQQHQQHHHSPERNIILFDLDCFYAQCYCIRLGYDVTITSLALFQWNSVLAVTYPARNLYNIQRGDTWDIVSTKSHGLCHCVHVPISTLTKNTNIISNTNNDTSNDNDDNDEYEPVDGATTTTTTTTATATAVPSVLIGSDNSTTKNTTTTTTTTTTITQQPTLQDEYNEFFRLLPDQQHQVRQQELNVRKYSTQGKANIEIFRIASAMILQCVYTSIQEYTNIDSSTSRSGTTLPNIVLERASIDEFFVDVSKYMIAVQQQQQQQQQQNDDDDDDRLVADIEEAMKHTVIISEDINNHSNNEKLADDDHDGQYDDIKYEKNEPTEEDDNDDNDDDDDDVTVQCLRHSCSIAYQIRQRLYTTLGFHMSAGIGTNKTLAKLAASYGKPAGQAVLLPRNIMKMLHATPIRKCRHLGGKVGKQIQALLPSHVPTTLGSIVQYVSLVQMQQQLSNTEMAQKIYHLVRGIDHEIVESKTPNSSAVLTKSITAFKSLRFFTTTTSSSSSEQQVDDDDDKSNGHTLQEAMKWIDLLIHEIVSRVGRDTQRNERYPKNLVIQYYSPIDPNQYSHQNNKSIRILYPSNQLSAEEQIKCLSFVVPNTLQEKVVKQNPSSYRFYRIGLCATDFESIKIGGSSKSIDTYFSVVTPTAAATTTQPPPPTTTAAVVPANRNGINNKSVLSSTSPKLDNDEKEKKSHGDDIENIIRPKVKPITVSRDASYSRESNMNEPQPDNDDNDEDYNMAKKLQEAYDHEDRALQVMEKKRTNLSSSLVNHKKQQPPIRKINTYFTKKK